VHCHLFRLGKPLQMSPEDGGGSRSSEEAVVIDPSTSRRHRISPDGIRKCAYLFDGNEWRQRVRLDELELGHKLEGVKVEGSDLLEGKTGPKVFFECGVGRIDSAGRWHIVNGMLRLGKRGAKKSVTRKRVDRLTGKVVDLYVSKIRPDNGAFEVSTSLEQVQEQLAAEKKESAPKRVPVSSLKAGQEVVGTVIRVEPYGVLVDVGANRHGLLHIRRVRKLMNKFIDGQEGLIEAGLERGAKIRVAVMINERKRLFLDFTEDVFEETKAERRAKKAEIRERKERKLAGTKDNTETVSSNAAKSDKAQEGVIASISDYEIPDEYADEAAAWAAYGAGEDGGSGNSALSEDEAAEWAAFAAGDEHRDEDDDIEDALGISTY